MTKSVCLFKNKKTKTVFGPVSLLILFSKINLGEQNLKKKNYQYTELNTFTKVKKSLRFKTHEITVDTNE